MIIIADGESAILTSGLRLAPIYILLFNTLLLHTAKFNVSSGLLEKNLDEHVMHAMYYEQNFSTMQWVLPRMLVLHLL